MFIFSLVLRASENADAFRTLLGDLSQGQVEQMNGLLEVVDSHKYALVQLGEGATGYSFFYDTHARLIGNRGVRAEEFCEITVHVRLDRASIAALVERDVEADQDGTLIVLGATQLTQAGTDPFRTIVIALEVEEDCSRARLRAFYATAKQIASAQEGGWAHGVAMAFKLWRNKREKWVNVTDVFSCPDGSELRLLKRPLEWQHNLCAPLNNQTRLHSMGAHHLACAAESERQRMRNGSVSDKRKFSSLASLSQRKFVGLISVAVIGRSAVASNPILGELLVNQARAEAADLGRPLAHQDEIIMQRLGVALRDPRGASTRLAVAKALERQASAPEVTAGFIDACRLADARFARLHGPAPGGRVTIHADGRQQRQLTGEEDGDSDSASFHELIRFAQAVAEEDRLPMATLARLARINPLDAIESLTPLREIASDCVPRGQKVRLTAQVDVDKLGYQSIELSTAFPTFGLDQFDNDGAEGFHFKFPRRALVAAQSLTIYATAHVIVKLPAVAKNSVHADSFQRKGNLLELGFMGTGDNLKVRLFIGNAGGVRPELFSEKVATLASEIVQRVSMIPYDHPLTRVQEFDFVQGILDQTFPPSLYDPDSFNSSSRPLEACLAFAAEFASLRTVYWPLFLLGVCFGSKREKLKGHFLFESFGTKSIASCRSARTFLGVVC